MDTPLLSLEIKKKELFFQSFFNCFIAFVCLIGTLLTHSFMSYVLMFIVILLLSLGLYDCILTRSSCLFYEREIHLTIGTKTSRIPIDSITAFDWQSFATNYGVLRIHTATRIYTLPKRIFAHLKEIKLIQESLQISDL